MQHAFGELGQRIRRLREAHGLSQDALASGINATRYRPGIRQSHISNLENSSGDKLPSVAVLAALAEVLETNTDFLLGLTDDDAPPGDLDDQVVVAVEDPDERRIVQEVAEAVAHASRDDKLLIAGWISRLLPKKPRIIGDE